MRRIGESGTVYFVSIPLRFLFSDDLSPRYDFLLLVLFEAALAVALVAADSFLTS